MDAIDGQDGERGIRVNHYRRIKSKIYVAKMSIYLAIIFNVGCSWVQRRGRCPRFRWRQGEDYTCMPSHLWGFYNTFLLQGSRGISGQKGSNGAVGRPGLPGSRGNPGTVGNRGTIVSEQTDLCSLPLPLLPSPPSLSLPPFPPFSLPSPLCHFILLSCRVLLEVLVIRDLVDAVGMR